MIDIAVTLLPEPLSPTSPRTSPRRSSSDTSFTACAGPNEVGKLTDKPSIRSSVSASAVAIASLRRAATVHSETVSML